MVKMAASDDDSRSEVSEILASCDNTSPKKKDIDQNSETSSDPFEVCKMKGHYMKLHVKINIFSLAELQSSS